MSPKELAKLSGVSVRTLHYYDEIGLLVPARDSNDYRIYSQENIDLLQQILFFRQCGFPLSEIMIIIKDGNYDSLNTLGEQREILLREKGRINNMITTIDRTISHIKGEKVMSNKEKFEALKDSLIDKNLKNYGGEVAEKYGEEQLERSNKAFKKMTQEQYSRMEELSGIIKDILDNSLGSDDEIVGENLAQAHKEWLSLAWNGSVEYSKHKHVGVVNMYLADSRFTAHYGGEEQVLFLKAAVEKYL